KVPLAMDIMGITGMTQMAMISGFDGKVWSDESFIGMSGPKKGLLALLDSTPLSDGLLAMVPKDAVAMSAWKMDLQKMFNEVRTGVGKVDLNAQKQLDQGLLQANQGLGTDIETDILAPLGDEW